MARTLERQFIQERAYSILKNAYGSGAQFHPGQLDAIVSVVSGRRGPFDIGLGDTTFGRTTNASRRS